MPAPKIPAPNFIDNGATATRAANYVTLTVDVGRVLESWRESLFSYEWLRPDGTLKDKKDLPPAEQPKRDLIEQKFQAGAPLEKPVLGIGLMDNIEIGAGRATFLTLAVLGIRQIPVHVPKTHEAEFAAYKA